MNKNKIGISLLAVLLGFAVGAIIMIATGHDPVEAYAALLKGAGFFGNIKRLGDTLLNMTTLILTGLAIAFAFRTGLFNIGTPGQMLMGGYAAVYVGVVFKFSPPLHAAVAVAAAIIAGALWAFVPGILKARYRVHEVVSGIMMNYIAMWTVYYLVPIFIPGHFNTESKAIHATATLRVDWLSKLFKGSYVNVGLFLALAAVVLVWWILEKTTFGYELKAVGFNIHASKYAGMKVNRNMVLSMMISGALAGLAGATFYIGYANNIKIGMLPAQGFEGIAVALLGMNNPFGVALAAFLFGFMNAGRLFMQSATRVPNELVPIIIAVIIFFAATSLMLQTFIQKMDKIYKKGAGGKS